MFEYRRFANNECPVCGHPNWEHFNDLYSSPVLDIVGYIDRDGGDSIVYKRIGFCGFITHMHDESDYDNEYCNCDYYFDCISEEI